MSFGLGSKFVSNIPLAEYLNTIASEFRTVELHADPRALSPYFTFNTAQKQAIRIYQDRYKFSLTMHAPFGDCRLGAVIREERQIAYNKILTSMQLASELHIKLITFHPCLLSPEESYPEMARWEEESIAGLLKEAKKLGQTLLLENMPGNPAYHQSATDGSRFQELLWMFPESEFGLTIDVGHALHAKIPIDSLLKMDRIRHFHFHENDRTADQHFPITTNLRWWSKTIKKISEMLNFRHFQ